MKSPSSLPLKCWCVNYPFKSAWLGCYIPIKSRVLDAENSQFISFSWSNLSFHQKVSFTSMISWQGSALNLQRLPTKIRTRPLWLLDIHPIHPIHHWIIISPLLVFSSRIRIPASPKLRNSSARATARWWLSTIAPSRGFSTAVASCSTRIFLEHTHYFAIDNVDGENPTKSQYEIS